tara:strand:+ start:5360 stop:8101 length:2742 start_codon:yes stop_codon:yes gene_type:complete
MDLPDESMTPTGPYSAPQMRMDTWNDLQVQCAWLKEFKQGNRDLSEPKAFAKESLTQLRIFESYWAFPGVERVDKLEELLDRGDFGDLSTEVRELTRLIVGDAYRQRTVVLEDGPGHDANSDFRRDKQHSQRTIGNKPYFEVLVVDGTDAYDLEDLREGLRRCRRDSDEFIYEIVTVPSFEDALIAIQFNWTIQTVLLRYNYAFHTKHHHSALKRYLEAPSIASIPTSFGVDRSVELGKLLRNTRPELDLFLITDAPLDRVAGNLGTNFRRVFYRLEQYMEQHLSILKGIRERFEAPFFDALRKYSTKPTGVFHALPIARGKSMSSGHWAKDLLEFYGPNIFMAETSATSGGLDSLLQPKGPIKRAQDHAARAFGARHTFFVTNGTSTANKIVAQAMIRPGDIVLVDRDCHKSHHYALVLSGAMPVYLDSYALTQYSMYGAVPLEEIEHQLLALKEAGKLDQVRMLILTNCTFDGLTYDPARVMERILAIKPDMIFLWDEAWYAYARFSPTLRRRTAMDAAHRLRKKFRSKEYLAKFEANAQTESEPPMVDPSKVCLRVYATHSTHKTLTSLRQGSMIHVYDEDFEQKASDSFHEAFMTHTSTSPNYQIVASLDVGRRQVELEGFEMVEQTIGLAMILRQRVNEHPDLARFFKTLRPADMIPSEHRPSGLDFYFDTEHGWGQLDRAYCMDEFTLDPTRVTLYIGATGMDGDTFRHLLMDKYDIQINKTSRNTVLFMPNIGTTRGDIAYLVDVLVDIATDIADRLSVESDSGIARHNTRVESLMEGPHLPNFSRFHDAFKPDHSTTPEGDLRRAYFLAYDEENIDLIELNANTLKLIKDGHEYVSAAFITPYPPGFPVLVPGQVLSAEIIAYLLALDVKEIHGYDPVKGLRVFTDRAVEHAAESKITTTITERL